MKSLILGRQLVSIEYNKNLSERKVKEEKIRVAKVSQLSSYDKLKTPVLVLNEKVEHVIDGTELGFDSTDGAEHKDLLFELAIRNKEVTNAQLTSHSSQALDHIKRLVVIGDSLSDSEGRMKSKTLGVMLSSRQYYKGRFTNGFVWADFISSGAYLKKYMKSEEARDNFKLLNYAEGGAVTAKYSKLNPTFWFISNMKRQIHKHEKEEGFQEGDMVVLALSANDYMTFDKTDVEKVVNCYEKEIIKMVVSKGVKYILVTGIPDLSITAHAHKECDRDRAKMSGLSNQHNQFLKSKLKELQERFSGDGVKIGFFDFSGQLYELVDMANQVGYDTTTEEQAGYIDLPRVFGLKGNSQPFDSAHRHVFHDEVHPSQEVHQMLASRMCDFIVSQFGRTSKMNPSE